MVPGIGTAPATKGGVMDPRHQEPLKGEGRLTDELLREKLQRGKGPIVFRIGKSKRKEPRRDIHHGLR
jgi:hypothetical protein